MKKWEYSLQMATVDLENAPSRSGELLQKGLKRVGEDGWELCSAFIDGGWVFHYFKRPVKATKKRKKTIV